MTIAELVVKILFQSNDPQALGKLKSGLKDAKQEAGALAQGLTAVNAALTAVNAAGNNAALVLSRIPRISRGSVIRLGSTFIPSAGTIPLPCGGMIGPPTTPTGTAIPIPSGTPNGASNSQFTPWSAILKDTLKATTIFTVAIDALNLAMTKLVVSGGNAALVLSRFRTNTGGNIGDLQRLQGALAVQGISGDQTLGAMQAIKDAQAQVKLGQGNPSVLGILGIDVNENDMNVIISQIQKMSKMLDPNIARQFAQQIGIGADMLAAIQNVDLKDTGIILSVDDVKRLNEFNEAWNRLGRDLIQFKNQVAVVLAPVLKDIAWALGMILKAGEAVTSWLKDSPIAAGILEGFGVALIVVGALLPVIAGGLLALIGISLAPELAAWTAGALALGSAFGFLAAMGEKAAKPIESISDALRSTPAWFNRLTKNVIPNVGNMIEGLPKDYVGAELTDNAKAAIVSRPAGSSKSVQQTNHISVSIDGSKSPQETLSIFDRHLSRILTGTMATTGPALY